MHTNIQFEAIKIDWIIQPYNTKIGSISKCTNTIGAVLLEWLERFFFCYHIRHIVLMYMVHVNTNKNQSTEMGFYTKLVSAAVYYMYLVILFLPLMILIETKSIPHGDKKAQISAASFFFVCQTRFVLIGNNCLCKQALDVNRLKCQAIANRLNFCVCVEKYSKFRRNMK